MATHLSALGGKIADNWLGMIFTPAFAYWAAGVSLLVDGRADGWKEAAAWLRGLSDVHKALLAVLALLVVVASASAVRRCAHAVIRLLEGYWPSWMEPLRRWRIVGRGKKIEEQESRYKQLGEKPERTEEESNHWMRLENELRWVPPDAEDRMPTELGDVLRSAEMRPRAKYGLDGVLLWPRLWLRMPHDARRETASAREDLDTYAALFLWGALFCFWGAYNVWAIPAALLVMIYAYRSMVSSAKVFTELLDTAYDLYRWEIYKALGWPLPQNPKHELESGVALTHYVMRGSGKETPSFVHE